MRALLIVNPNATSTTAAGRDLLAHALESRVRLTVAHTTHRGHAAELAREAHEDGFGSVIVHGGDGTVNEVVNGLLGSPHPASMKSVPVGPIPTIAVVPGGSANVFARSLGIAADPIDATNQLVDLLSERTRRRIGLAHCDNRWFTFNAGMGLDADVCEAVDASRKNGDAATPARYVRTAIAAFFRAKRVEPALTVHLPRSGSRLRSPLRIRLELEPVDISGRASRPHQSGNDLRQWTRHLRHDEHQSSAVPAGCAATTRTRRGAEIEGPLTHRRRPDNHHRIVATDRTPDGRRLHRTS